MSTLKRSQTVQPLISSCPGSPAPTIGYVEQAITPHQRGRVCYQATYWFGICADARSLPAGMEVTVLGRQGNTLIVRPIAACSGT